MDGDIIFIPSSDVEDISIMKPMLEEAIISTVGSIPIKMPTDDHWVLFKAFQREHCTVSRKTMGRNNKQNRRVHGVW